jgi:hypothetical protein
MVKIKKEWAKRGLESIPETWRDLWKGLLDSEKETKQKSKPVGTPSRWEVGRLKRPDDPMWEKVKCEGCGSELRRELYISRGHGPQCDRLERYAANHAARKAIYKHNKQIRDQLK